MSFFVEDSGGSFERCPSGMHLARCYRIIDLGTQKSEYMGQVKYLHKISIGWEIHGTNNNGKPLRMKDNRPFAIFKNYTLSWSEKANLRLDLQSWRGKPFSEEEMRRFDLDNVLDAWCMLNVIERTGQDGKMYTNINGVTPVTHVLKFKTIIEDGEEKLINILPKPVNKKELFNIADPDMELFNSFSDHLKKKIEASPEWQKRKHSEPEPAAASYMEDNSDIPF
jgi:hypothetical protein